MITTNDDLELPLMVGTFDECAEYLGEPVSKLRNLYHAHTSRGFDWSAKNKYRIYKVEENE